ncbi:MAG: ACT domain-containing protein [Candidatus Limnocylindrales bacterium]
MTTDITVGLVNQPGTLLRASDALGRAGVNIEGACGYVCDGQGVFHVLVEDAQRARTALIDAGLEIHAERTVVATSVENRPGSAASVLRRVAAAQVNLDLVYVTADRRLVLGGADLPAIKTAVA